MDENYISIQEMAVRWNMSKRRIQVLCKEGRIKGAKMAGNMWVLPEKLDKPNDARRKNPIYKSCAGADNIKNGLKSLLKEMYSICFEQYPSKESQRNAVLASIASALIMHYTNKNGDKIYEIVQEGMQGDGKESPELLNCACAFVAKYKNHTELDNIVSWSYQYSNKILGFDQYAATQFFTDQYMIRFLNTHMEGLEKADKIVDPCCGGGNFLLECLEFVCHKNEGDEKAVLEKVRKLYAYDIDEDIVRIAFVNLKIKVMSILYNWGKKFDISIWDKIKPNLFVSASPHIGGALHFTESHYVVNLADGQRKTIEEALGNADFIMTNPPFQTIKGMDDLLKAFLKKNYDLANCDTCAAFFQVIAKMLKHKGTCGIVTQNSWMHLDSFTDFRMDFLRKYSIRYMVNLGSGAFADLSGEKTNISLAIIKREGDNNNFFQYTDLSRENYDLKKKMILEDKLSFQLYSQSELKSTSNGFDFTINSKIKDLMTWMEKFSDVAVPMQGTSTGNVSELVGYFWQHFGDSRWRLASKGGGYCRWQGLNSNVVKWGINGEYIQEQKGSALRNAKYFGHTFMVFSDTGTSGLNVRIMLPEQIFIASGPGIRVNRGNPYALLAYLNSRIATYYIRKMSPKLTIAAGYIGKLPICSEIYNSVVLEEKARQCIVLKQKILRNRPANYEYDASFLDAVTDSLDECSLTWFKSDLKDELLKLEIEGQMDRYILSSLQLREKEEQVISESVGVCADMITAEKKLDMAKLDLYIAKLLDDGCNLKRSKTGKNEMGCDGILEYMAKDLKVNPRFLVYEIENNLQYFKQVKGKYKNLLLHNEILNLMQYNPKTGVKEDSVSYEDIYRQICSKYGDEFNISAWIDKDFDRTHKNNFKNAPILKCRQGYVLREEL